MKNIPNWLTTGFDQYLKEQKEERSPQIFYRYLNLIIKDRPVNETMWEAFSQINELAHAFRLYQERNLSLLQNIQKYLTPYIERENLWLDGHFFRQKVKNRCSWTSVKKKKNPSKKR